MQVIEYIDKSWDRLTRDNWVQSKVDPKLLTDDFIVYIPESERIDKIKENNIKSADKVNFEYLPPNYTHIKKHGLLYLPHPYVVPGGRFNEMYAWDSFLLN
nr:alpha,alpha-trehalase [Legionella parisiensis]